MTIADLQIRQFSSGQAFNILALSSESFAPNYTLASEDASEVWALSRADLSAALDAHTSEKRRLALLVSTPLRPPGGGTKAQQDVPSPAVRGAQHAGGADAAFSCDLSRTDTFCSCSAEFLWWVERHLETTAYFPDEVVVREGARDQAMYVICQGTIVMEGTGTHHAQVSMGKGAVFGEQHVLEVADIVQSTATAVEITMVQVLHLCILQRGLELFPKERRHMSRVAVSWLNQRDQEPELQVPLFDECSKAFVNHVSKLVSTRMYPKGSVIVKEGDTGCDLMAIRSGCATATSASGASSLLQEHSIVGAEVVLGIWRSADATVQAEQVCAVGHVSPHSFQNCLHRHHTDVVRLMQSVVAGPLFPTEAELVPIFRGVSPEPFRQLVEASEWVMILPDQYVVRQGTSGSSLHILCYGSAISEVDGVVLGPALEPGECIGVDNIFGARATYKRSVRTRTVCHFRHLTRAQMETVVIKNPAENERFEQLGQRIRQNREGEDQERAAELARRKLRKRTSAAFHRHVETQTRSARAAGGEAARDARRRAPGEVAGRAGAAETAPGAGSQPRDTPADDQAAEPRRRASRRNLHRATTTVEDLLSGRNLSDAYSPLNSSVASSDSDSDDSQAFGEAPTFGRQPAIKVNMRVTVMDTEYEADRPSEVGASATTGAQLDQPKDGREGLSEPGGERQADIIGGAIHEFISSRRNAAMRGKVLRLLHSGMHFDGVPRGAAPLTEGDLLQLDDVLPPLPAATPRAGGEGLRRLKKSPLAMPQPWKARARTPR